MSQIPLIKIEKKTNGKIEQAKTIIRIFCLLSDIKLSDAQLTVLAYFMVYKLTQATQDLIIKAKVFANEDSLRNVMTVLRKTGLIKKVNKTDILHESLDVSLESIMAIAIKIDNK